MIGGEDDHMLANMTHADKQIDTIRLGGAKVLSLTTMNA